MRTSQATTMLSNPMGSERVPRGTFGYFQARNKYLAYSLVLDEFKKSGLSQADLARRLGKGTDIVCRLLSGPSNWTLDTFSDFLFAISGATPLYDKEYPLNKPRRKQTEPDWLRSSSASPLKDAEKINSALSAASALDLATQSTPSAVRAVSEIRSLSNNNESAALTAHQQLARPALETVG
jgi:hypothetical protein